MKKVLSICLALMMPVFMFAAEEAEYPVKRTVEVNSFWSNWFIQADGGAQLGLPAVDGTNAFNTLTPSVSLSVGKWFTPSIGTRVQFNAGHYSTNEATDFNVNAQLGGSAYADVMFNLSNMLCGYDRHVWNVIPYVGFGRCATENSYKNWGEWSWNAGLDNHFRVSNRLLIDLDLYVRRFNGYNSVTDLTLNGSNVRNWNCGAEVGLVVELGNNKWNHAADAEAMAFMYGAQISVLQETIERLANHNKHLEDLLGRKPTEVVKETVRYQNGEYTPVWFAFDSAELTDEAKKDLDLVPTEKEVSVVGYASPEGEEQYNKDLSLRRAQAVADYLKGRGVNVTNVAGLGEAVPEISRVVVVR